MRRLDRYATRNADFVLVAPPHSGPRRAQRAKERLENQPRDSAGISRGGAPWLVLLTVLILPVTLHLHAQETRTRVDVSKRGPQVGERVPDFRLVDQTGTERTLQSVMGRRGAMLIFIRSADW